MPFNASGVWWSNDKTCWWGRVGDCFLTFCPATNSDPSTEEYIEAMTQSCQRDGAFVGGLTYLPSSGPSASQRKRLGEVSFKLGLDKGRRIALLSESALARGALTAYNWLVR